MAVVEPLRNAPNKNNKPKKLTPKKLIIVSGIIAAIIITVIISISLSAKKDNDTVPIQASVIGWHEDENGKYYLSEDNTRLLGESEIGGQLYYFNDDGILQTGVFTDKLNNKRLADNDGVLQSGFKTITTESLKDAYVYASKRGIIQVGAFMVGENEYYSDTDGKLTTNAIASLTKGKYNATVTALRYYDSKGKLLKVKGVKAGTYSNKALIKLEGKLYVTDQNGILNQNCFVTGNKKTYYATKTGALATGWTKVGKKILFGMEDGSLIVGKTVKIDGVKRTFDKKGYLTSSSKGIKF